MAGEAKSTAFMLGAATVLVGPQSELFNLNVDEHSLGLVKNFRISAEPAYTDLTQGVKNTIVYSVMTGNTVKAAMETYEYTAKNLNYGLGIDGSAVVPQSVASPTTAVALANAVSITVAATPVYAVGDYIMIQDGTDDRCWIRKVSTFATGTITFTPAIPKALPIGTMVRKVNAVSIGLKTEQPYLAAKIIGTLADGTEVVIMCPKIRITNGFSVGFTTDNFDNMPFEFAFYDSVIGDPFYSEFATAQAKLFTTK